MSSEPVMDNPILGRSNQPPLGKMVQDLQDCIAELVRDFKETQLPITDDNQTLHRFCAKLEFLLQTEQKVHTSLFGGKKDYWDFFCSCLSSTKGVRDGVKFVKSISELKTSLGRGRAFLRFCLMYQRLADSLQQCVMNGRVSSEWYTHKSIWLQHNISGALINNLYDLNSVQFDLAPKGYDLDTAWPTFARKQFGTPYHWNVPMSRTSSMSSLASQDLTSPMKLDHSLQAASTPVESEMEKLEKDLARAETLRRDLLLRIEELEQDNEQAHQLAMESEERYMQTRQEKHVLDIRFEKLSNQLELKENSFTDKEENWKTKYSESQKLVDDLNLKIGLLTSQQEETVREGRHVEQEFKEKVLQLEREKGELKIQVHSLTIDLENKMAADEKKNEQISQLETKLSTSEQKNVNLISKMENLVQEKDTKASSHFDSANKVHELVEKISQVEQINIELRGVNEELQRKLGMAERELQEKEEFKSLLAEGLRESKNSLEEKDIELHEMEKMKSELDTEIEKLSSEKQTLSERVEEKDKELLKITSQFKEISQNLEKRNSEFYTLESKHNKILQSTKSSESLLQNQLKGLQTELTEKDKGFENERTGFANIIENLQKNTNELKTALKCVEQDLQLVNAQKLEYETKVQTTELKQCEKMDSTAQELECQNKELQDSQNELLLLKDMIQILAGDPALCKQNIPESLQATQKKLQQFRNEQDQLQIQLRNTEAMNSELKSQVTSLTQSTQEFSKRLNSSKLEIAELKTLISRSEAAEADLQCKLEVSQTDSSEKDDMLKKVTSENDQYKSLVQELKLECQRISALLNEKDVDLQKLEGNLTQKCQQIDVLTGNLQKLTIEMTSMTETTESVKKSQGDQLNDLENNLKDKCQQVCELEKEKDLLMKSSSSFENDIVSLKVKIDKQGNEMDSLNSCKRNLERQLESVQTFLTGNVPFDESDFEENTENDSGETSGLLKRIEFLLLWKDKVVQNLESEQEKMTDEIDNLKSRCDELKNEKDRVENANEELTVEIEKLRKDFEEKLQSVNSAFEAAVAERNEISIEKQEIEREISSMKHENESLQSAVSQSSSGSQELIANAQKKDSEILSLTEDISRIKDEKSKFEEKLKLAEEELEKNGDLLQSVNDEKYALENKLSKFKEMEQHVERLEKQNVSHTHLQESLEKEKEALNQDVQLLNEEKKALTEEVERLKKELEVSAKNCDELREKMAASEKEWEATRSMLDQELSSAKFQLSSEQLQYETALKGYSTQQEGLSDMTQRMSDQEQLIQSMELQLQDIKVEKDLEEEAKWKELEELRSAMEDRNEECAVLADTVKKTGQMLETEKRNVAELKEIQKTTSQQIRKMEEEISLLRNDNVELKKKLIKLIKEKDTLWQKTDKLEYEQKVKATEIWIDERQITHCMGCKAEFSFMLRKHHCRMCGRVFCWNCGNNWIMTTMSSKKARACNMCYIMHTENENMNASILSNVSTEDNQGEDVDVEESLQIPRKLSKKWQETPTPGSEENSPKEEASVVKNTSNLQESPSQQKQNGDTSENQSLTSGDNSSVGGTSLPIEEATSTNGVNIPASNAHNDDRFEEITDEEIARSLTESGDNSSLTRSLTVSVEEIEQGRAGTDDETDLWVRAGSTYAIPVVIDRPGIILCWEFRTEPKSIAFSATYKVTELTPDDQAQVLIPICKCNSHRQAVQGELTARQAGAYTLIFDNTSSRFTSKKLMYRLNIKKPTEA